MIQSTVYILVFVVSIVKSAPNSYLNSIPRLGEWISTSWNSENELGEVENKEVPNEESHKVVNISKSNEDIKVGINHDETIPVDDLLDQLSDELKRSNDQQKREIMEVSQQLETALYDNTLRKVNVLIKGIWHVVDLGLAGSSQRKRCVEKLGGVIRFILSAIEGVFCYLFPCSKDKEEHESLGTTPESFDPRKAWPHCKDVISYIRTQGDISNCSIVTTTSSLSDRLCIASKGTYKKLLSSEDVMRCCKLCPAVDGSGYYMSHTLDFLESEGTVTGGEYGSEEGCIPYTFPPLNHPASHSRGDKIDECNHRCTNEKYSTPYEEDKHYINGFQHYKLPEDTAAVKTELMTKGSCIAPIHVYDDLHFHNTGGIYTGGRGKNYIRHAIRLIGWGKENGVEYWLVANTWGKDWGEDGIGKLKKGCCGLGQNVLWCVNPKIPNR